MDKILLKNKEEFDSFIGQKIRYDTGYGTVKVHNCMEEPQKYPCIAVWEIQYNGYGPNTLKYELVYLDDFEV